MPSMPQPTRCRPEAFELLCEQVDLLESPDGLLAGAVAIAMHEMPDSDPADLSARLDDLVMRIRSRVRSGNPQALLAHAHVVLFEEEGFIGNKEDYYNPRNSYLPFVMEERTGIPITLSLVYKTVIERLGIRAYGINAPGHFLVGVKAHADEEVMIVDPFFGGRINSPAEAIDRLEELFGRDLPDPHRILEPASHREWLGRMINNLWQIFAQQRRDDDMVAMSELKGLLDLV